MSAGSASPGGSVSSPGPALTGAVDPAFCRYLIREPGRPDRCWLGRERRAMAEAFAAAVSLLREVSDCEVVGRNGTLIHVVMPAELWHELDHLAGRGSC